MVVVFLIGFSYSVVFAGQMVVTGLTGKGLSETDSCLHEVQFLLSVPGQFLKPSIE